MKKIVYILALLSLLATTSVQAQPTIVYQNKCIKEDWPCLNRTQAAKRAETREQVNKACRGVKCPIIFSIDPIKFRGGFEFGAWKRNGRLYFSAMPKCPNARWMLERVLRRTK